MKLKVYNRTCAEMILSTTNVLTLFIIGTLSSSEEPHEMTIKVAFHLSLHCLLRRKKIFKVLKYEIDCFILIVSIFMKLCIFLILSSGDFFFF